MLNDVIKKTTLPSHLQGESVVNGMFVFFVLSAFFDGVGNLSNFKEKVIKTFFLITKIFS